MAYDLALSENFDLVVTGARDLAGVSGDALISQRIKIRLRIARGSWVLDDSDLLGSTISYNFGSPASKMIDRLPEIIRQALSDMDEIEVIDVIVEQVSVHQVYAKVFWRYLPDDGDITNELEGQLGIQETNVVIGTGGD